MACGQLQETELHAKTLLLREAIELLMWEHTAISNQQWEDIPALKQKKTDLANRLKAFDWMPRPEDRQEMELMMLKSQLSDLEYQSQQKIKVQMEIIKTRLQVLKQQQRNWTECLHLYCGIPSNRS